MYGLFVFLFEGRGNPFSFYFVFALVEAAIRWEWRGTLWTAVGALTLFAAISLYFSLQPDVNFELYRWLNRVVFLAVIAGLVGYLGAYEGEWRREVAGLAGWSRRLDASEEDALRGAAANVAEVLNANRIIVIWEDEDNPGCDLVSWSRTTFSLTREPPEASHHLVAGPLQQGSFFCEDASSAEPVVWRTTGGGLERWVGVPLGGEAMKRFAAKQVLGVRLLGDLASGWLLALDKPHMTVDDILLGQIVAREVVAQLDNLALSTRLRRTAVSEERLRLAGDLHDGLLQSLTAAALQIEAARGKLRTSPTAADEDLDKVQGLLRGEQHDLRFLIEALRPATSRRSGHREMPLGSRLQDFVATVQRVWRVGVTLDGRGLDNGLAINGEHEVYRMVQEAVINAARHAAASAIRVSVVRGPTAIHVSVIDDGHGFPFEGRRSHQELAAQDLGPVSLRRRVMRLGGAMTITSTRSGAQVEIDLPLATLES
jgi:signal transduction histidine kinase